MHHRIYLWFLFFLIVFPVLSLSQSGRTELLGVIRDASGLPVPNATVTVQGLATMARFLTTSDDRGEYHLIGLPAGQYVITVEQAGFAVYRQSGITLRLADRAVLDVKLQVGQTSETLDVT